MNKSKVPLNDAVVSTSKH